MRGILLAVIVVALSRAAYGADVSVGDFRVVEGDAGDRAIEVTLSLSPAAAVPVAVSYSTRDGSAVASDYRALTGTVTFARGEVTKRVALAIVGDTAVEADEAFDLVVTNVTGATVADGTGTVTIVNDDARPLAGAGPALAVYEVRLTYTGVTGSMAGSPGCPVRPDGKVVMTGLVGGNEKVSRDADIEYTGVLQLDADIDLCEVRPGVRSDQAVECAIRVVGIGPLKTDLSVYADDRGSYVKAKKAPGSWLANLSGSCDGALIGEERAAFPDDSMANVFNGTDLPLPPGPLRVGRWVGRVDGNEVVAEVLRVVRP